MEDELDEVARTANFSGVVRVEQDGAVFEKAYGLAHRGYNIANTVGTRFAIASGCKAFTALAVVSLIDDGTLSYDTKARELLGDDLPLIDDEVTVRHLLAHRSGIGDYFDEEVITDINEYVLPVPVQNLLHIEQYLAILDGYPQKFPPGTGFAYNNGGYVVLSLIAERASGVPYHDLVRQRVCEPAGLAGTEFLRSDSLGEGTAIGYLPIDGEWRTNVFHLPIRGGGDGGIYTTAADVSAFWRAFFAGRIVSEQQVAEMVRPHSEIPEDKLRYGLGFWLHESTSEVQVVGWDAGVSFKTVHQPETGITRTVLGNTSDGVWPVARFLNGIRR
ncbi:CubicO group peptidase (beta-lactamase class C family) [Lentzea atacamensis]|uniref:CubicO group peptidase (Beta-lactamase class C family) n=1 Tax=Lentzea atacamensis TaxID=531938 RepID=A0A316HWY6_9PSEU|nr:serine hydrolase domain-containing protein [Lentzea atacamensis]PWK79502.1 CubicO group peptidase (beta-lactamase class C family) [Lentzea atacamensis]